MSTMKTNIKVVSGGELVGDGWIEHGISEVNEVDVSGTILDVKTAIKNELDLEDNPQIFYDNNCLEDKADAAILTQGGAVVAVFVKDGSGNEAKDTKFKGGNVSKWIVTGCKTSFNKFEIKAGQDVTVPIQKNSIFPQEHKFAVVMEMPNDKKWRGMRYELTKRQSKNPKILLKDNGTVSVIFTNEEDVETEEDLTPAEEIEHTYDEDAMLDRQRRNDNIAAFGMRITMAVITFGCGALTATM